LGNKDTIKLFFNNRAGINFLAPLISSCYWVYKELGYVNTLGQIPGKGCWNFDYLGQSLPVNSRSWLTNVVLQQLVFSIPRVFRGPVEKYVNASYMKLKIILTIIHCKIIIKTSANDDIFIYA